MTEAQVIGFVQQHFNDQTNMFRSKIVKTLPMAVGMFACEHQWEFLDKYTTCTTSTDSTTGKDEIDLPSDIFKPVVLWTEYNEMRYIDRKAWGDYQRQTLTATRPSQYTIIGSEYFLHKPNDGSTIYMIYTRLTTGMSLADVPAQYHDTVAAALVWRLTPGLVGGMPNAAYGHAEDFYQGRVRVSLSHEANSKARTRTLSVPDYQAVRSQYR